MGTVMFLVVEVLHHNDDAIEHRNSRHSVVTAVRIRSILASLDDRISTNFRADDRPSQKSRWRWRSLCLSRKPLREENRVSPLMLVIE